MALQFLLGIGMLLIAGAALAVTIFEIRRRHEDHEFHSAMLDALDDRVCRFGVDDLVLTYCNQAWARSVGWRCCRSLRLVSMSSASRPAPS